MGYISIILPPLFNKSFFCVCWSQGLWLIFNTSHRMQYPMTKKNEAKEYLSCVTRRILEALKERALFKKHGLCQQHCIRAF